MSELNCAAYREDLLWYAAGQLDAAKSAAITAHLAACADCRAEVAQWRDVAASLRPATSEVPAATFQATWASIQLRLPPQPQFNGSAPIAGVTHMEFESDAQRVTPRKTRQPASPPRRTTWFAAVAALLVVVMGIAVFGVLHSRNQVASPNGTVGTPPTLPAGARLALPTGWEINSAAIVTPDDIWGVGVVTRASRASGLPKEAYALIVHYTAGQWQVVDSGEFASAALESITMVSATEGWAVGYTDTHPVTPAPAGLPQTQTTSPLILHYHAGVWQKATIPTFIGTLYDVQMSTANEGIATGFDVNDAPTVLLHYKDGVWASGIPSPEPSASAFGPGSVTYAIGGDAGLWAIGDHGVYRSVNDAWQNVLDPTKQVPNGLVTDIAVSGANDVWVRLTSGTTGTNAVVAHYDGKNWKVLPIPAGTLPKNGFAGGFVPHSNWLNVEYSGNSSGALADVVGAAPALPRRPDGSVGGGPNLLLHYDGSQWHAAANPTSFMAIKDISATQSIAVGSVGQNGVQVINIYHYQNGVWS